MSANSISIHPVNENDDITNRIVYPFPFLKNPLVKQAQDYVNTIMLHKQYRELGFNEKVLNSFVGTNTAHITAWWHPTADFMRMIALSRFMTWTLGNDEIYEHSSVERLRYVKEQSVAILKGQQAVADADIIFGSQLDLLRLELLQFVPQKSVDRFADELRIYFEGIEMESPFRTEQRYPTLEEYRKLRRQSICTWPFVGLIEVETGAHLPDEIYYHPHVRQFAELFSGLVYHYNDAQSLYKDETSGSVYTNLITVMEHDGNISRAEAIDRLVEESAALCQEFVNLQATMPDFGKYQDAVVNHVHHISFMVAGWKKCTPEMHRYSKGGFPTPEELKVIDLKN